MHGEATRGAARRSGGGVLSVSDVEILDAQRLLAASEGVFAEPASAAAVAGLLRAAREGWLPREGPIVCVPTGHGLKDVETAVRSAVADGLPEPEGIQALEHALAEVAVR